MILINIKSSNEQKLEALKGLFNSYYEWESTIFTVESASDKHAELVMDVSSLEGTAIPSINIMQVDMSGIDNKTTDFDIGIFSSNSDIAESIASDTRKNFESSYDSPYIINKYGHNDETKYISISFHSKLFIPYISTTLIDES